ncbi:nucleoside-diphosphate sugar epimerase [Candidatus Hepatincola sp. Av]
MNILAIHDGKLGHVSQITGVLEYLPLNANVEILKIPTIFLKLLPVCLLKQSWLIPKSFKKVLQELAIREWYPQKIIAVGKRTLPFVLYTKAMLYKQGKQCKIIYLMPPTKKNHKSINLTFFHSYKDKKIRANMIPIGLAPHFVTPAKLLLAKKENIFKNVPKPIITVLIGGDAKNIHFNESALQDLIFFLKHILQQTKGTLIISTSRRTKPKVAKLLEKELSKLPAVYFNYHENKIICSNLNLNQQNELLPTNNLYFSMLAAANYVVVTGESISMLSESCSLPNDVGVYVFFSKNFYAKRYVKFHNYLYAHNYAKPLKEFSLTTNRNSYSSNQEVANYIIKL